MDFLAYANGKNDLFDIANYLNISVGEVLLTFETLKINKLLTFKKMKIIIGLQARTNSKRLPGKVFKKINDKPLLSFVIDRLKNKTF